MHGQIARVPSEHSVVRDDVSAIAVGHPAFDLSSQSSIDRALCGNVSDAIINTAAFTDMDGAEDDPDRAHRKNAIGLADLAANTARRGILIIRLSTAQVFDGRQTRAYVELDTTDPVDSYDLSKLRVNEQLP